MIINPNKIFFLKNFLKIYIITIIWICPTVTFANFFFNQQNTTISLQYTQSNIHNKFTINNISVKNVLYLKTLIFFSYQDPFKYTIKKYHNIYNNHLYIIYKTYHKYNNNIYLKYIHTIQNTPIHLFIYNQLHIINYQLINTLKKTIKNKIYKIYIVINTSLLTSLQQNTKKYMINNLTSQLTTMPMQINTMNVLKKLQHTILKLKKMIKIPQKITKSKFMSIDINNQKQSSSCCLILFKKKYNQINDKKLQIITYSKTIPSQKNYLLPKSIQKQLNINYQLTEILNQQTYHINVIISKHQEIKAHILQVHQIFNKLLEQKKWLEKSPALKEILRAQITKLPNIPNFQKLNNNINQLQKKRFQYEHQIKKLPSLLLKSTQDNGAPLTLSQKNILNKQLTIQHNLITSLLNSYDTQILELTKLKFSYEKLHDALQKIQNTMYRYLFWVADIQTITISYPLDVYQDFYKLFTENKLKQQITSAIKMFYSNKTTLILLILNIIILIGLHIGIHRRYQKFLKRSNKYIGKVNQDNFLITFHNIWISIIIALPVPIFWFTIGYILNHAWKYPVIIAIGHGMQSTTFILWISIISSYFASPQGLFISHFGWSKKRVQKVFSNYYILSISTIILLTMFVIIFNNYNEKEFYTTLGRLCFISLCIYLTYITNNLKHSKLPLYINKYDSSNNIINHFLWNIMIFAPIIAIIACIFGYFFAAQELLMRLEISLFIWITLLIIYHLVRRWMSIQRRRIAFERAKQKRAQRLAFNNYNESNIVHNQISINNKLEFNQNNKKTLDLDTINTQSLQLIRSIITLIAILSMTLLWSKLHSAFYFLENITLWDVTSTIKGVNNIQPITLNSFLIAVLVIIITTKTVHNLPAFLELTLLQHLKLNPGTGYAITTLTKYILMLLGSIIGFSLIGIEWSKIQWLIAALGVGLGFGLQEIFANFISGIMILFEKPIRIGDTITIRNLTGNVTRINTRATTITDWDHKEIIIPNKEFITKKFINWSLSDTITRVVLKIPGSTKINAKKMTTILLQIVKNSSLALSTPPPEVYLSDLQNGFPIFEIRIYVADTKSRMPLCHQVHLLITEYYQKNNIELPCLFHYMYKNQFTTINKSRLY